MRFVYTKYGILTEERAAELKELDTCGETMDECGYAGNMEDMRMGGFPDSEKPVKVVIVSGDSMLGEGGMDGPEGSPGYSSNQGVVGVGPQGIPGSAAGGNPGGANTVRESFNRYRKLILETKKLKRLLEQKVEEGQLTPELEEQIGDFLLNTAHLRNFFDNFLNSDDSANAPIQLNHDILPELSQVNKALSNIRRFLTTGQRAMVGANFRRPQPQTSSSNAVVRESFNQYAEFLLESWLEEELHGDQDRLDLDDDGKIEASDLKLLRRGLKDKHVGSDRKR